MVQKPRQLGSSHGTTFNRGVVGGIQFSGVHQSAFRPGFNAGGTSGSRHPLLPPIQKGTLQRGNQVPKANFYEHYGFLRDPYASIVQDGSKQRNKNQVADAVQQGVQEVHSEDDLDSVVSQAHEPVMVEFTTSWCAPCRRFAPTYNRIITEYSGKARFLKVTVNENRATNHLGQRFDVKAIPSFLLFHNKEIIAKEAGIRIETNLREALSTCVR
jgi:thiol-disulfide isomerase/thioredoxin